MRTGLTAFMKDKKTKLVQCVIHWLVPTLQQMKSAMTCLSRDSVDHTDRCEISQSLRWHNAQGPARPRKGKGLVFTWQESLLEVNSSNLDQRFAPKVSFPILKLTWTLLGPYSFGRLISRTSKRPYDTTARRGSSCTPRPRWRRKSRGLGTVWAPP